MNKRKVFWKIIDKYTVVEYGKDLIVIIPKNMNIAYDCNIILELNPKVRFVIKKDNYDNPFISKSRIKPCKLLEEDIRMLNQSVNVRRIAKYLKKYDIILKVHK